MAQMKGFFICNLGKFSLTKREIFLCGPDLIRPFEEGLGLPCSSD